MTTTPPDNAGLAERLRRASGLSLWFEDTGTTTVALDIGPLCAEAADYIEALRPSVWMDIRTAPKGVDVLVCSEDFEGPVVAVKVSGRDADWWTFDVHELGPTPCEVTNPTHWMHLPTPPKAPTP